MPLTKKEKEALRKKYREQRQAIWTGKPSSRLPSQDASDVEEIEVSSDEDAPDVSTETALPRRGDPDNMTSSSSAQTDVEQSEASNSIEVERSESQKIKTDSPQVRDRVQVQSEDTWQEQSSTHLRQGEQRGETSQNEESLWNSSDEEKGLIMLTWKLALGVVGTIIVLVGIGVLLGYWFAS